MNNSLTKRLNVLYNELKGGGVFADVGCDHGYVAEKAIENGLFEKVIISDISEKCLKKAEERLNERHKGEFTAIVSDGFDNLPSVNEAIVAGMGGEVMISMLARLNEKPQRLVLQPMKNAEKLREYLINGGYRLVRDYTFRDWKFYHVIVAEKSEENDVYTADELIFGRDNLREKSDDFKAFVNEKIKLYSEAALNASDEDREKLDEKVKKLRSVIE